MHALNQPIAPFHPSQMLPAQIGNAMDGQEQTNFAGVPPQYLVYHQGANG